ncbi:efflux RND transporter periplasmic adaptor subunit [Leptospira ognonensis]|nr:efflux RND transporter periplasmic adaptor subunit [Leptospira ognonensis]
MSMLESLKQFVLSKNLKISVGVMALLFVIVILLRPSPKPVQIGHVTKGTYQEVIKEEGISHIKEVFTIYSPVTGVLRRIEKHAGDAIIKGEVLAEIDWDNLRIMKSPVKGKILKIYRDSAGPVMMGERLMDVGDTKDMEVLSYLLTEDSAELNVKDKVVLTGFGDSPINAEVKVIEPSAITKVSSLGVEEQRVPVRMSIDPPPGMGDGYQLECKIILFEKPDSILIPTSALFRIDEKWAVFVIQNGKAKLRLVEISHNSDGIASVKSGIEVGEMLILYPGDSIKDGIKVKNEDEK